MRVASRRRIEAWSRRKVKGGAENSERCWYARCWLTVLLEQLLHLLCGDDGVQLADEQSHRDVVGVEGREGREAATTELV